MHETCHNCGKPHLSMAHRNNAADQSTLNEALPTKPHESVATPLIVAVTNAVAKPPAYLTLGHPHSAGTAVPDHINLATTTGPANGVQRAPGTIDCRFTLGGTGNPFSAQP